MSQISENLRKQETFKASHFESIAEALSGKQNGRQVASYRLQVAPLARRDLDTQNHIHMVILVPSMLISVHVFSLLPQHVHVI